MGCCCSSEKETIDRRTSLADTTVRIVSIDAIPYTPDPKDLPVRVYKDREDIRNNNNINN